MRIVLSNQSGLPIYEQIKEQVKSAILAGELKEGEMLPSIRQLAHDLKISVITTMRAYNELEAEGFVVNVQGKGCYVQPQNSELVKEQLLRDVEESLAKAVESAKRAGLSREELIMMLEVFMKEV